MKNTNFGSTETFTEKYGSISSEQKEQHAKRKQKLLSAVTGTLRRHQQRIIHTGDPEDVAELNLALYTPDNDTIFVGSQMHIRSDGEIEGSNMVIFHKDRTMLTYSTKTPFVLKVDLETEEIALMEEDDLKLALDVLETARPELDQDKLYVPPPETLPYWDFILDLK